MSKIKGLRKHKQLAKSKNGSDRNYLAKLLQERTALLKYYTKQDYKLQMKLNNISHIVKDKSTSDDLKLQILLGML